MQNFLGNYDCTLDSKGRLMIPAKFRRQVAEDAGGFYVLSMGKEKCLNLYPLGEWNESVVRKLHDLPPGRRKRETIRFYSRKSITVNIDKAGRVALPTNFLEAIGSPKKVVVAGVLNYMEIWAPEEYVRASEEADRNFIEGDWEY